jgi:hypothetical protein
MRNMGMLISIAFIVLIPRVVSAEMWKAHTDLQPEKSEAICSNNFIVRYTFDLTDSTLTATSQFGEMFSIPAPVNGELDTSYMRWGNNGAVHVQMTGNVKTRELKIRTYRCTFKLIPD